MTDGQFQSQAASVGPEEGDTKKQNFARSSFNSMSVNPCLFPISPFTSTSDVTAFLFCSALHHFSFFFFKTLESIQVFCFFFCSSPLQDVCQDALQGSRSAARGRCGAKYWNLVCFLKEMFLNFKSDATRSA